MIKAQLPIAGRYRWFWILLLVVHGALFVYDVGHPEALMGGDRAVPRHQRVLELAEMAPSQFPAYFLEHGVPGDYLPHALLYRLFGRLGLILVQIGLALVSVFFVHRIAERWTHRRSVADVAAGVYAFLPHSLAFPHILMTEALFNPLLIFGTYLVVRGASGEGRRDRLAWTGAFVIGLSSLIRVIGAMIPILLAPAVAAGYATWRKRAVVGVGIVFFGLAPVLLWMSFVLAETGSFSLGPSSFSLPHNLAFRVERMDAQTSAELEDPDPSDHGVKPAEYLKIIASNPQAYWKIVRSDLVNYWANPGVSKLLFNYLSIGGDLRGSDRSLLGWRSVMDDSGLWAAVKHVWSTAPFVATALSTAVLAWGAFMVLVLWGGFRFVTSSKNGLLWRLGLVAMVLAFWIVSTNTIATTRSGHRSPTEFILATFFALGVASIWDRRKEPGRAESMRSTFDGGAAGGSRWTFEDVEYRIRLFYGQRVRPLFPETIRRFAKRSYSLWGYRKLFVIRAIPLAARWRLFQRFLDVDFGIRHGHWPCEMAEIAKYLLESPQRPGAIVVEAGCWQGGSTAKLSILCDMLGYRLYVYDSFQGVESTDQEGYDYSGEYSADERLVRENVTKHGAPDVCDFFGGWFEDTIAKTSPDGDVVTAYVDCDLAKGTVEVLKGTLPRLLTGGVIFTQDFHIEPVRRVLVHGETWSELGVSPPRIRPLCHNLAALHFDEVGAKAQPNSDSDLNSGA